MLSFVGEGCSLIKPLFCEAKVAMSQQGEGTIAHRDETHLSTILTSTCIGTFRIYVRTERKSAKEFNIIFR